VALEIAVNDEAEQRGIDGQLTTLEHE